MSRITDETEANTAKYHALHALRPLVSKFDKLPLFTKITHPEAIIQKVLKRPFNLTNLWARRSTLAPEAMLSSQLQIQIAETIDEGADIETAMARGQFLARQDKWDILLRELSEADRTHSKTSTRTPVADLLAFGARADVINTAEHALHDDLDPNHAIVLDGIMALERIRIELKRPELMTTLVALAHIDLAWNCRDAAVSSTKYKTAYKKRGIAHFERAQALLKELKTAIPAEGSEKPLAQESPLTLAAQCALFAGINHPIEQIVTHYGRLIDLAPCNPRHMRALGNQLLPQNGGSYEELEVQALRAAARTQTHWGAGGYTWVYFDALANDPTASAHVNMRAFLDGLIDIVEHSKDQEMVNLLTAYCLVTLKDTFCGTRAHLDTETQAAHSEFRESTRWLVHNHLHVLHPIIWAHAASGFANNTPISCRQRLIDSGRKHALTALEALFQREIAAGHTVQFTPNGPQLSVH